MKRFGPFLLIFLGVLILSFENCSGGFQSLQGGASGSLIATFASGTGTAGWSSFKNSFWKSSCVASGSDFAKRFVAIDANGTYTHSVLYFSDAACSKFLSQTTEIRNVKSQSPGLTPTIQFGLSGNTQAFFDASVSSSFQGQCGIASWPINVAKSILGTTCAATASVMGRFEVDGSTLTITWEPDSSAPTTSTYQMVTFGLPAGVDLSAKTAALAQLDSDLTSAVATLSSSCSSSNAAVCALQALAELQLSDVKLAEADPSYNIRIIYGALGEVQTFASTYQ